MGRLDHGFTSFFRVGLAGAFSVVLVPAFLAPNAAAQQGTCNLSSGNLSVGTNRIPGTCYTYPLNNTMWANRIPIDAMQHLWNPSAYGLPNSSDYYAKGAMTARGNTKVNCSSFAGVQGGAQPSGCGYNFGGDMQVASSSPDPAHPRSNRDGDLPLYYAKSTDPVFSMGYSGTNTPCTTGADPTKVCAIFHAPAGAQRTWYGGGHCFASTTPGTAGQPDHITCEYDSQCSTAYPLCLASGSASTYQQIWDDTFLGVFDQGQQLFVVMENGRTSADDRLSLPNCTQGNCGSVCGGHAGTLADPCPVSAGYLAAESYTNDWDWRTKIHTEVINSTTEILGVGVDNGAGMVAGGSGLTRFEEFQTGIYHLIQGASTGNSTVPTIWPGSVAEPGTTNPAPNPDGMPGGAWVFLDYTADQINAMGLGPLQKAVITQMSNYGSILENWGNPSFIQFSESFESDMAYMIATGQHHPIYSWINGQKVGAASTGFQYTVNCGNSTKIADSQYNCEVASLYGIPLMPGPGGTDASGRSCAPTTSCPMGSVGCGCDVSGHFHVLDPSVLAGYIGPGQKSGEPTPTVGLVIAMLSGSGSGAISSNPAGMNCDHITQCNAAMGVGKTISLTAVPATGSTFAGWSGAGCSGTGMCTLTFGQSPQVVTATFTGGTTSPVPPAKPRGFQFK